MQTLDAPATVMITSPEATSAVASPEAAAIPAPQPADPQAAAHLQATEATVPPTMAGNLVPHEQGRGRYRPSAAVQALFADTEQFVGRQKTRADIKRFLSIDNRSLVVVGPPGSGKTALAARLVQESQATAQAWLYPSTARPWLYHFCGVDSGDNPYKFVTQLSLQLAAMLKQYTIVDPAGDSITISNLIEVEHNAGTVIGAQIGALVIGEQHPRELFRRLIQEPLQRAAQPTDAAGAPQRIVIVVDALDRAWEWDGGQSGNIVTLLSDVQDMPAWVNFICTARPGIAVQTMRARAGAQVWNLSDDVEDIALFLEGQVGRVLEPAPSGQHSALLAETEPYKALEPAKQFPTLINRIAIAADGSFLFARRYVESLHSALMHAAPEAVSVQMLIQAPEQLDATLADAYREVVERLKLAANSVERDLFHLLAVAFAPLPLPLIELFSGYDKVEIDSALDLLRSVLALMPQPATNLALYNRSFADYVRNSMRDQGRGWDLRIADALERAQKTGSDPVIAGYSDRFRWRHLQRGLQLAAPNTAEQKRHTVVLRERLATLTVQVPDPVLRARALRTEALGLLDPGTMALGAWRTALRLITAAEDGIWQARVMAPFRRKRQLRQDGRPLATQIVAAVGELEQVLVARGDAYTMIAAQLSGTDETLALPKTGLVRRFVIAWDVLLNVPMLVWILPALLRSGLGFADLLLSIPHLGRGLDWSVIRLLIRALKAYTAAAQLAMRRGDNTTGEQIADRMAQLYVRIGVLHGAKTIFNARLTAPTTANSPWQAALARFQLGETLVRQDDAEQAIPLLVEAQQSFVGKAAPIQQARTASILASAYLRQAELSRAREDDQAAVELEERALEQAGRGVDAWQQLTTLEGDDVNQVDPALGLSRLAGDIWRLQQSPLLAEEHHRRCKSLLEQIRERHFAQRFEHPTLRSFRVGMMLLVPLLLLIGLVFAVQVPTALQPVPRTTATFSPPLVSLTDFPDNLLQLEDRLKSSVDLVQTINSLDATVVVRREQPAYAPTTVARIIGLAVAVTMLVYFIGGLLVFFVSEPTNYQERRPGRFVLGPHSIRREAMPVSGARWRRWRVQLHRFWQTLLTRILRRNPQQAAEQNHEGFGALPAQAQAPLLAPKLGASSSPPAPAAELRYADIGATLTWERRIGGMVVYELSRRTYIPLSGGQARLTLSGSTARYDELVGELEQRIGAPQHRLAGELLRSPWGLLFVLVIVGAWSLLGLLFLRPDALQTSIAATGIRLRDLYVLVLPGLLVPLIWWGVFQPLQARMAQRGGLGWVWVALGSALLLAALAVQDLDLTSVFRGLNPDFLLSPLVVGLTLVAIGLALRRHSFQPPSVTRRRTRLLTGLALVVSFLLLGLYGRQLVTLTGWYYAVVEGNRSIEQATLDPACGNGAACPLLDAAAEHYQHMSTLRPNLPYGYLYAGAAELLNGNMRAAETQFISATVQSSLLSPTARRLLAVYQGAWWTRQVGLAPEPDAANVGVAAFSFTKALEFLAQARNVDEASLAEVRAGDERLALQHAQIYYTRALRQILAVRAGTDANYYADLLGNALPGNNPVRAAWDDLQAAISIYSAIATAAAPRSDLYHDSQVGLATAWLARGEFPIALRPTDQPGTAASYLRAKAAYQAATTSDSEDLEVYGGAAWIDLRLNAPDDALRTLHRARELAPDDPRFAALTGLAWWLHSDAFIRTDGTTRPGYHRAMNHAVAAYTAAIERARVLGEDLGPYYATRSVLYFKLRNTTTAPPRTSAEADVARDDTTAATSFPDAEPLPPFQPADYKLWMERAISDMDVAINLAEARGDAEAATVGYHYWRGRLHAALALTWQERRVGHQPWRSIVAHYTAALDDFIAGTAVDASPEKRNRYVRTWLNPVRALARNAGHIAIAEEAIRVALAAPQTSLAEYERAVQELQLVTPRHELLQTWDKNAQPNPDYTLATGFLALATSRPLPNPLLGASGTFSATLHYEVAIKQTQSANPLYVPASMRAAVYTEAICQLDHLLTSPPPEWSPAAREETQQIRAQLLLARTEAGGRELRCSI